MPNVNPDPGMSGLDLGSEGFNAKGFRVVLDDLQQAARTFQTEAATFGGIMPDALSVPDGGSAAFDSMCQAVIDALCTLHLQIGTDIGRNGAKLAQAHDNYQHTEETLIMLCQQLTSLASSG